MGWDRFPILPTFEKARRREIYRKLARLIRRREERELLSLEEVRNRLRLFEQNYVGVLPIRVDRIVGTADRTADFDKDFLPKKSETRGRWRDIEHAFPLSDFPPIIAYQVGDAYFVEDGHHRVAIAKQRGVEFIDAEVTELKTRVPLPPDADVARLIHAEQERIFLEESGLDRARPEARIEFSRPHGYMELLDLVKVHGYHLMLDRGEILPREEIAAHWWDTSYLPAVEMIRSAGIKESLSGATDADIFLWVTQRRRAFLSEHGYMTFEEAARQASDEERRGPKIKARSTRKATREPG
jgi:hypothetical protein